MKTEKISLTWTVERPLPHTICCSRRYIRYRRYLCLNGKMLVGLSASRKPMIRHSFTTVNHDVSPTLQTTSLARSYSKRPIIIVFRPTTLALVEYRFRRVENFPNKHLFSSQPITHTVHNRSITDCGSLGSRWSSPFDFYDSRGEKRRSWTFVTTHTS